jgi:hypothetical protein
MKIHCILLVLFTDNLHCYTAGQGSSPIPYSTFYLKLHFNIQWNKMRPPSTSCEFFNYGRESVSFNMYRSWMFVFQSLSSSHLHLSLLMGPFCRVIWDQIVTFLQLWVMVLLWLGRCTWGWGFKGQTDLTPCTPKSLFYLTLYTHTMHILNLSTGLWKQSWSSTTHSFPCLFQQLQSCCHTIITHDYVMIHYISTQYWTHYCIPPISHPWKWFSLITTELLNTSQHNVRHRRAELTKPWVSMTIHMWNTCSLCWLQITSGFKYALELWNYMGLCRCDQNVDTCQLSTYYRKYFTKTTFELKLSNSMEQSPWEANQCSNTQETPYPLWKIYYHVHMSMEIILNQWNVTIHLNWWHWES